MRRGTFYIEYCFCGVDLMINLVVFLDGMVYLLVRRYLRMCTWLLECVEELIVGYYMVLLCVHVCLCVCGRRNESVCVFVFIVYGCV